MASIEERLAVLERKVAALQKTVDQSGLRALEKHELPKPTDDRSKRFLAAWQAHEDAKD